MFQLFQKISYVSFSWCMCLQAHKLHVANSCSESKSKELIWYSDFIIFQFLISDIAFSTTIRYFLTIQFHSSINMVVSETIDDKYCGAQARQIQNLQQYIHLTLETPLEAIVLPETLQ